MPELDISDLARDDIKKIGKFSEQKWGMNQRTAYLEGLDKTINRLLTEPYPCRPRNDVSQGLRSVRHAPYLIFFSRNAHGNVMILRVLHERMDFQKHL